MKRLHVLVFIIGSIGLSACAQHPQAPSVLDRIAKAQALAGAAGWHGRTLRTQDFVFKTYGPTPKLGSKTLTIYIEGDGFAWKTTDTASENPTPITPIGLKIAIHDKKNTPLVYLARACQFVVGRDWKACKADHWTANRFSPKLINATNQAINTLKTQYNAKKIILIGYSGGGVIAALVTTHRTDVLKLITIAAPLDIDYWVRQKNLTPLHGSLNPADAWQALASIPQTHWVGGDDTVVPKEVAFAYARRFPSSKKPNIHIIPSFNHTCCWATDWIP